MFRLHLASFFHNDISIPLLSDSISAGTDFIFAEIAYGDIAATKSWFFEF